jgi:multiple sugar transport system permease protein
MMRSFFTDVPIEIEEAAMVDGCSRWKTLTLIVVPAVAPGIMAAATLAFITLWNDFIFAMFNTGRNTRTLPVEIYSSLGYYQMDWAKLSTSAVIAIIPAVLFIAFTQKYIVRGLTMGAVKG